MSRKSRQARKHSSQLVQGIFDYKPIVAGANDRQDSASVSYHLLAFVMIGNMPACGRRQRTTDRRERIATAESRLLRYPPESRLSGPQRLGI
jgi:hypothetical protein